MAVSAGVGRRVCRWIKIPFAHPTEQLVLGSGLGLGVLSLSILGMGLLGWLARWVLAFFLGGLALFAPQALAVTVLLANREALCRAAKEAATRWRT